MSKRILLMQIVFLMLIIISAPVFASNVFSIPTGDTLNPGTLEVDYSFVGGGNTLDLNYGIYSGLNIGVSQWFGSGGSSLAGSLKVGLMGETQTTPALAVGGALGSGGGEIYLALSKQLGTPVIRGHAGIGVGTGANVRPMAGVTAVLNPVQVQKGNKKAGPTTVVFLEYDNGGVNGGIMSHFNPNFKAKLGLATNSGLLLGLNYKVSF